MNIVDAEGAQPTSGREWRKPFEEGILYRFPSGNVARLRPVDVDFFIKMGRVPDLITPFVVKLLGEGKAVYPKAEDIKGSQEWVDFLNALAESAFVSPRIVANPQADEEIGIYNVSWADKVDLLYWFARPVVELKNLFRLKAELMAALQIEPGDTSPSEPDIADKTLGEPNDRDAGHLDRNSSGSSRSVLRGVDRKQTGGAGQQGQAAS
jgi:hypothetical protein